MKDINSQSPVVMRVDQLSKVFGKGAKAFQAVDNVSFDVKKGEIVGLLGPNGAGKTTTFQMLLGLMKATSGQISYFGQDFEQHRTEILQRINHASGYSRMPWRLSVYENLNVFAWMYNVPNRDQKIREIAEAFEMTNLLPKLFQNLSAGQMTRCLIAKAFLNEPELVLLDEPTASLDPDIADKIRKYLLNLQKKKQVAILITSHNMREVEELCDRVVFLSKGKVLAIDTPQGLARRNKNCELQLMVTDGLKRLVELVESKSYEYKLSERFITIILPEQAVGELLSSMGQRGLTYTEIEIVRPSLEDFFLDVSQSN